MAEFWNIMKKSNHLLHSRRDFIVNGLRGGAAACIAGTFISEGTAQEQINRPSAGLPVQQCRSWSPQAQDCPPIDLTSILEVIAKSNSITGARFPLIKAHTAALMPVKKALEAGFYKALRRQDDILAQWYRGAIEDISLTMRNISLPSFLRNPPPTFHIKSEKKFRAYVIGDWGSDEQTTQEMSKENGSEFRDPRPTRMNEIATTIKHFHLKNRFLFGLTVGDNFYPNGLNDPANPRWATTYEKSYGDLGVPLFATLGNHDYEHDPSAAAAEILYTLRSKTWRMPAEKYSFTVGGLASPLAQFFAINTESINDNTLEWLRCELQNSRAKWKVLYGHWPLNGPKALDEYTSLRLQGVIRNKVQLYLSGHWHTLQHTKPVNGVEQFIIGGGGAGLQAGNQVMDTLFASENHGFGVIEVESGGLLLSIVSHQGEELYRYLLKK